jgi:chemotaxis protein methyltransferase CheR
MKDNECVQFLQWALPRLHMQWPGFRKVRTQVCKRISRRMQQLQIDSVDDYRTYLETHAPEWQSLDTLSRVTISRFYRDKAMFAFLESDVMPALVRQAIERGEQRLRVWSAGAGSGEEPYTVALIWALRLQSQYPQVQLEIIATDIDPNMNRRARAACYLYSSIKNLPADWREQVFRKRDGVYCLESAYRGNVRFIEQDIRTALPPGPFDLVLCRNLAFTYFEVAQQREILNCLYSVMVPGGALVIGIHEDLPEATEGFSDWSGRLRIFQKDYQG